VLAKEIEIISPLEPAEVLANLRERGKEWRESSVPEDLRKLKVGPLCITISDLKFDLRWSGNVSPFFNPVCSGTLEPTQNGTRITARFGRDLRTVMPYFLLVGILVVQVVAIEPRPIPVLVLAIFFIIFAFMAVGKSKVGPLRARLIDVITTAAQPPVANPAVRMMSTNGP